MGSQNIQAINSLLVREELGIGNVLSIIAIVVGVIAGNVLYMLIHRFIDSSCGKN
jgi:type III secretory pathway component EscT